MRWIAVLVLAIALVSMVPTANAAGQYKTGSCITGFTHVRAMGRIRSYDANHNGWVCERTVSERRATRHFFRDDRVM